ncbi:hypothetical protein, conserved [Plasmodium vivax]|uniref:VIR protein n=1 Tax=Plasmodium vivax TaxID=5855 RepID=A0A1G4E4X5_PLAVI|nr:hypothetical protein, conserved [Plasmodium vivax]
MFSRRIPTYSSARSSFQKYVSIDGIQKYNNYKNEIEQKIINYYGDPDIKNFSEICTSNGKCNFNKIQAKKTFEPKTVKKGTCTGETNCEKPILSAGAEKITSVTRPLARNKIAISSPQSDPKDHHQKVTDGQELKKANVSTQPQPSIKNPAPHVVPEIEVPGKSANLDFRNSEENHARPQPLVVAEPKENVLVTPPRDHPVETITIGESGRGNSSEVSDSDKNIIPSKLLGDQTQSNNSPYQINTNGKLNLHINFAGQANGHHNIDTAIVVEHVPPQGNTVEKGTTYASANGLFPVDVLPVEQQRDGATTSIMHLSGGCDNTGMTYTDNEDSSNRTLCNERSSDQVYHSETLSSKGRDSELFNDNGNILDRLKDFFESIPNNERVIKTSAPIGIALLLGHKNFNAHRNCSVVGPSF